MSNITFPRCLIIFMYFITLTILNASSQIGIIDYEKWIDDDDTEESLFTTLDNISTDNVEEIPNITCITDKFGIFYKGFKNSTADGTPCINWDYNRKLKERYHLRNISVVKNYCRNPDADHSGPWCFIQKKPYRYQNLPSNNFKSCGIPMCRVNTKNFTETIKMGVPMLIRRECPKGFTLNNKQYCIVNSDFFDKLPDGAYAMRSFPNENDKKCSIGFKEEKLKRRFYLDPEEILCHKQSKLNKTIAFPKSINPKNGELIFMAIFSTQVCPPMMYKTSTFVRKSMQLNGVMNYVCYYFYKLAGTKNKEDKRLAFLTLSKNCPNNWISKSMAIRWKFAVLHYNKFVYKGVYACYPNKDINEYPDGNYCLLSLSMSLSVSECPEEFRKVTVHMVGWQELIICCRSSTIFNKTNLDLFKFFNFSSVMIINNGDSCTGKDLINSNIKTSSFSFTAMLYGNYIKCVDCDLVKVFTFHNISRGVEKLFSKATFTTCNYDTIKNGFAYASISSTCPPQMEYAYIKYLTAVNNKFKKSTTMAKFCTKINYPEDLSFPKGKYCLYKIGSSCPKGFITSKESLPLFISKAGESNGYIPNSNFDSYCCNTESSFNGFENAALPYVTSNFEFGLPFPNDTYTCTRGLTSHTAVHDTHMCEYYPVSNKVYHTNVIFSTKRCDYRAYVYYGSYRLMYNANHLNRYCYYYAKNNPPAGNYCIISAKVCPNKYFYYITYHPLSRAVICCRKKMQNETKESLFTLSDWVNDLKDFSLLAYNSECQIFQGYNQGKQPNKVSIAYKVKDVGISHITNLSNVGKNIKTPYGYTVWIESCLYKLDPLNKSRTWPHGNYAFPKTLSDCPSDFKQGYFTHSMESASPSFAHSDIIHLDGDYMIGGTKIKWGFCVKKDKYIKERLHLPYGRYCLMKVGKHCPLDFKEGSVKFVEITAINNYSIQRNGDLPEIENDGPFITYNFCCQSGRGDVAHAKVQLPINSGPFYLFKFGLYCQSVEGMTFTEEYICIDAEDSAQHINFTFKAPYTVEGFTPITGSYSRGCDFQINLCYYQKDSGNSQISTPKPNKTQGWPTGSYVFIKSLKDKCPPLFNEERITVYAKFKIDQKFLNILMFGAYGDKETILSYCERNNTSLNSLYPSDAWPRGVYCVIFEKKCPPGMLRHKFRSINNIVITTLWDNLCCKKDILTSNDDLPYFPADQYSFIILPTQEVHSCPAHKNMRVALITLQREILCYYERIYENIEFPDGDYLLPAPWKSQSRCSPGFQLVTHYHSSLIKSRNKPVRELVFCQKENNGSKINKFPRGNYCILTTNAVCPSSQFTQENVLIIPLYQFLNQQYKLSRYLACCQNDDHLISNVAGMKVPFQMFASEHCSYVDGMVNANEAEESSVLEQRGSIERPPYIKSTKKIRLCRYDQASVWNYDSRCQCHKNAACFLTVDDVKCGCKPGYFGDGKTVCSKKSSDTDQCGNVCKSERSECVQTKILNIYKCQCKEGFEGDGFNCKPSCNKRDCGVFGHCIVNSIRSYCDCLPDTIRTSSNSCNGDLINTIALLSGFDILNKINFSCFENKSYSHLISPNSTLTLFIIIPPNDEVFSTCNGIGNYYGLYKDKISLEYMSSFTVQTEGQTTLHIAINEKKQWLINSEIFAYNVDIFTNAVVLYLNQSVTSSFSKLENNQKLVSQDSIIAGYTFGTIAILIIITIGIAFIIKRRRIFDFNRLHESRSETNIHFFSSDNKIEIDS